MARTICLIIYKSPLFPAHWSLWIPSLNNPITGKRLHATGDAANGFEVVFERDYNLDTESRSYQLLVVAEVSDTHVIDVEGNGSQGSDATAHDDVERVLLSVTPPGPSLVSSTSQVCDRDRSVLSN